MPDKPKPRMLKMELEPDDPNLLANLLAAVTSLVDGLEAVQTKIDAVHLDVRALVKPAPRRGMERLEDIGAQTVSGDTYTHRGKP